jgi:phenylpyruvate tautomerase PptA (4-oxalocrotonate tautomerase family)
MPLWTIYHPVGVFEADHKQALAKTITKLYNFPAFYVGVVFIELDHDSFYRGGERTDNFVRIAVDHINLTWKTPEEASRRMKQFDEALAPMMRDRGLVWEFHVDETRATSGQSKDTDLRPADPKPRNDGSAKTSLRPTQPRLSKREGMLSVRATGL